jgi:hypothetical protein
MIISQFANQLSCQYCSKPNKAREWPASGDMVPFYCQKERGNFSVTVTCKHCGKEWYVVWDDNPGPISPLLF